MNYLPRYIRCSVFIEKLSLPTILVLAFILFFTYSDNSNFSTIYGLNNTFNARVAHRVQEIMRQGLNETSYFTPPLVVFKNLYKTAPQYELASCDIEKVMSTIFTNIMCYLYDSEEYIKKGGNIATDTWESGRDCRDSNTIFLATRYEKLVTSPTGELKKNWRTFVMIRDPMERFISGFLDKCINEVKVNPDNCYKCKGNLECVLDKAFTSLDSLAHLNGRPKPAPEYDDRHFAPQTWYCSMAKYANYHKFIKYAVEGEANQQMVNEIRSVLQANNVPKEKVAYIAKHITSPARASHSTANQSSTEKQKLLHQIKTNQTLLNKFLRIYYYDYVIFDYPLPKQ